MAEVSLERNKLGEGDEFILKMPEVGEMKKKNSTELMLVEILMLLKTVFEIKVH